MASNNSSTDKTGLSGGTNADRVYHDGAWHQRSEVPKPLTLDGLLTKPTGQKNEADAPAIVPCHVTVRLRLKTPSIPDTLLVLGVSGATFSDAHANMAIAVADLDSEAANAYADQLRLAFMIHWNKLRTAKG